MLSYSTPPGACRLLLHRKSQLPLPTGNAGINCTISFPVFHLVLAAVKQVAMQQTPRASSLVENLNSRLHYFFLRRQLGPQYLSC